jgi:uncharacterized protein (TIGR02271 family)
MALHRIKDFDPNYRDHFDHNDDIKGLDLYSGNEKIGSVNDVLVDDDGQFRYLVINTGAWIFGKKVLLPIGRSRIDYNQQRVYVNQLTKAQVEALPEFKDDMIADYEHEEQVRGVYRSSTLEQSAQLETSTPLEQTATVGVGYSGYGTDRAPASTNYAPSGVGYAGTETDDPLARETAREGSPTAYTPYRTSADYTRDDYSYDRDPLYTTNEQDHQNLKLYQERLIANKQRQKAGEVAIGKTVETERAEVSVPIEKERVVIERVTPSTTETVMPGEATFQEGEVARMEVYEETADIKKEAYVREEVRVQKVSEQEVVTAEEQLRREELDVDTSGNPRLDQTA